MAETVPVGEGVQAGAGKDAAAAPRRTHPAGGHFREYVHAHAAAHEHSHAPVRHETGEAPHHAHEAGAATHPAVEHRAVDHSTVEHRALKHRVVEHGSMENRVAEHRAVEHSAVAHPVTTHHGSADGALKAAMSAEAVPDSWHTGLEFIMMQESGGRVGVRNPASSARGLFQLTASNYHLNPHGAHSFGNAVEEAQGGIRYIEERYGTVDNAVAHWRYRHTY